MRSRFIELLPDTQSRSFRSGVDYDVGAFNPIQLWEGQRIESPLPAEASIVVSEEGELPDYMVTPISWPLVSDRLASLLGSMAAGDVQFLDIKLVTEKSRRPLLGYRVMNITSALCCIDHERSRVLRYDDGGIRSIPKLVLREDPIPESIHLFRLGEYKPVVMYSVVLNGAFRDAAITGLTLRPEDGSRCRIDGISQSKGFRA